MSAHTQPESFDVVIIGSGPVGKMAALLLGRAGHSVLVVDRKVDDYPLPRAVGHDAEIARLLQRAGLPVDEMPDAVEPYDDLYVWVNAGQEVLQEIDVSGVGPSGWNNMYFYNQPTLEGKIAGALGALPTVDIRRGVAAHVAAQDGDGVTVALEPVNGSAPTLVRARYVVGADGANSATRKDAGIGWHDLGYFFDWLVVDVIPGDGFDVTHLAKQVCDPVRPTTVVPAGPGRRRWEFMLLEGENPRDLEKPERVWELLAPFGVTPDNATVERGVVYTFAAGWAEKWSEGRVFLAGDAAHLMPPFAAQGLASGFRDVLNLSWKLDLVLRGGVDASLLESYEAERVAHVNDFIQFSVMLAQVICITDPAIAAGRDAQMLAAIRDRVAPQPPPAPRLGVGLHAGLHGGELSRQGFVTTPTVSGPTRFDDVFGPGALIVRGGADGPGISADRVSALADLGIAVVAFDPAHASAADFTDVSGSYADWFGQWGVDAVLVRPDFFVYDTVGAGESVDALADRYLASVGGFVVGSPA